MSVPAGVLAYLVAVQAGFALAGLGGPQKSPPRPRDPVEPLENPPEPSAPIEPQKSPSEPADPPDDKPWPDPTRRRPRNLGNRVWSVVQKAGDNPIATGLIVFGAGMLVGALIPVAEKDEPSPRASGFAGTAEQVAGDVDNRASMLAEDLGAYTASSLSAGEMWIR